MAKILHIIPYFQPEFGYEEVHTVNAMIKLGHDVSVITSQFYNPRLYAHRRVKIVNDSETCNANIIRIRTREIKKLCQNIPHLNENAKGILKNSDVIIFHTNTSLFNFLIFLWILFHRVKTKIVVDIHKDAEKKNSLLSKRLFHKIMMKFYSFFVDLIVKWNEIALDESYKFIDNEMHATLVVDEQFFMSSSLTCTSKVKIRIGFIGRLNEAKRIDRVVDELKVIGKKAQIEFIGPVDEALRPRLLSAQNKFEHEFVFHGNLGQNEYRNALKGIDYVIFYHHASIGVVESLLCGVTPVLGPHAQKYYWARDIDLFVKVNDLACLVPKILNHNQSRCRQETRSVSLPKVMAALKYCNAEEYSKRLLSSLDV